VQIVVGEGKGFKRGGSVEFEFKVNPSLIIGVGAAECGS
jgi:hypothetical protein